MAADLTSGTGIVNDPADPPIGARIREERARKGMNLRALARAVGVSASHISQIETGKCRPSVSTLWSITTVLGVPLDEIFEPSPRGRPAGPEPASQAGDRGQVRSRDSAGDPATGPTGAPRAGPVAASADGAPPLPGAAAALAALAAGQDRRIGPVTRPGEREQLELESGVIWERLGQVPGLHMDFLRITYAPGSSSSSAGMLMRHSGTEYGYLISGQLVASLGFDEHVINAGDAICFESSTPHRYRNEGNEPTVGIWFVFEPELP